MTDARPVYLNGTNISNNYALYGGAFYILDSSNLLAENVSFKTNFALLSGGTIHMQRQAVSSQYATLNLTNCKINGSLSLGSGGTLYLDHRGSNTVFLNTEIFNTSSTKESGGFALINSAANFIVKSSFVLKSSAAVEGHILKTTSSYGTQITLNKSNFTCRNDILQLDDVLSALSLDNCSKNGSGIFVASTYKFEMIESTV